MQIDPCCQRRKCSLVNVVSINIRVVQIFAGVREISGVKQESGRLRCRFLYLSLAIFSESSSPRLKSATHSICVKLLHKHDKLTQCCRAFTLALARLSCKWRWQKFLIGWLIWTVTNWLLREKSFIASENTAIYRFLGISSDGHRWIIKTAQLYWVMERLKFFPRLFASQSYPSTLSSSIRLFDLH